MDRNIVNTDESEILRQQILQEFEDELKNQKFIDYTEKYNQDKVQNFKANSFFLKALLHRNEEVTLTELRKIKEFLQRSRDEYRKHLKNIEIARKIPPVEKIELSDDDEEEEAEPDVQMCPKIKFKTPRKIKSNIRSINHQEVSTHRQSNQARLQPGPSANSIPSTSNNYYSALPISPTQHSSMSNTNKQSNQARLQPGPSANSIPSTSSNYYSALPMQPVQTAFPLLPFFNMLNVPPISQRFIDNSAASYRDHKKIKELEYMNKMLSEKVKQLEPNRRSRWSYQENNNNETSSTRSDNIGNSSESFAIARREKLRKLAENKSQKNAERIPSAQYTSQSQISAASANISSSTQRFQRGQTSSASSDNNENSSLSNTLPDADPRAKNSVQGQISAASANLPSSTRAPQQRSKDNMKLQSEVTTETSQVQTSSENSVINSDQQQHSEQTSTSEAVAEVQAKKKREKIPPKNASSDEPPNKQAKVTEVNNNDLCAAKIKIEKDIKLERCDSETTVSYCETATTVVSEDEANNQQIQSDVIMPVEIKIEPQDMPQIKQEEEEEMEDLVEGRTECSESDSEAIKEMQKTANDPEFMRIISVRSMAELQEPTFLIQKWVDEQSEIQHEAQPFDEAQLFHDDQTFDYESDEEVPLIPMEPQNISFNTRSKTKHLKY